MQAIIVMIQLHDLHLLIYVITHNFVLTVDNLIDGPIILAEALGLQD